jgi:predicted DNA-binding protein (MmcQ/YjbR family)
MGILITISKLTPIGKRALVLFLFLFSTIVSAAPLDSLKKKFPQCDIKAKSVFPSENQYQKMKDKFPTKYISKFYSYYLKKCDKKLTKIFVLSDVVRTKKQFLLFEISDKSIKEIEILKFLEPSEYKVRKSWLNVFIEMKLNKEKLSKDVDAISGATLSGDSTKFLAWQALELHRIIESNER